MRNARKPKVKRPGKRRALDMGKEVDRLRDQRETTKGRIGGP